jgi:hypothetical protein
VSWQWQRPHRTRYRVSTSAVAIPLTFTSISSLLRRRTLDLRWKAAAGLTVGALAGRSPDGGTNKLLGLMGFAQMSAGERSLGLHLTTAQLDGAIMVCAQR